MYENFLLVSAVYLQMGRTPLHLACEKGHVAAAAALVAGGADLLAKDKVSSTVRLAGSLGNSSTATLLWPCCSGTGGWRG
jgi:ankyrin repeat protein